MMTWCSRQFRTRTVWTQDVSASASKCPYSIRHLDTLAPGNSEQGSTSLLRHCSYRMAGETLTI